MTAQTISMELRRVWIQLQNTERGVLLQREVGDTVFYAYGDYAPHPDALGMSEDAIGGPSRLRGGSIWLRSRNWSRVSVTPHDVDSEQADVMVGNLGQLNTTAKTNLVDALNEVHDLVNTKADAVVVGDPTNINFADIYLQATQS